VSVRYALLALLAQRPMYGYQLKSEFEGRLGQTWPLNVGQVYTTLARLERDGLVQGKTADPEGGEARRTYRISDAGRAALAEWFASPVSRNGQHRDELLVKVVAALEEGVEPTRRVIRAQRTATLELLQRHARTKAEAARRGQLARLLAVDLVIAHAEADAAWLDRCEARVVAAAGAAGEEGPR
jgi:DNA-binding PadR family transcriptional regulator